MFLTQWMRARWTSDPCYAFYGVDGSDCSFLIYLSEVEWFCPPLVWRNHSSPPTQHTHQAKAPKRQVRRGHTHITNSDVTNNHRSWWNSLAVNECWTGSGNVARTASEFKYWLLLLYTKQVLPEHFCTKDWFKLNEESEWNGQDFNKVNY